MGSPVAARSTATLSIRIIWAFARAVKPEIVWRLLPKAGVSPASYADPDTRISHRAALEWLDAIVQSTGDRTVGLRAGELIQPGDFDAVERALEACSTLHEANECYARHARLMNEAVEIELGETEQLAILKYRITDGVVHTPAASDFFLAILVTFARQHTRRTDIPTEVHFTHGPTSYIDEYKKFFRSKLVFDAPENAVLTSREAAEAPMRWANPAAREAFELRARELLERLERSHTVAEKVRELVLASLHHGRVHADMEAVARKLAMSVATLRRRLDEEEMGFSDIVDEARKELALRHLADPKHSVTDVAFLLGFADVGSFHRAFKRWTGLTPAAFRAGATLAP